MMVVIFSYKYDNGRRGGALVLNQLCAKLTERGIDARMCVYRGAFDDVMEGNKHITNEDVWQLDSFIGIYPEDYMQPHKNCNVSIQYLLHKPKPEAKFDYQFHYISGFASENSKPLSLPVIDLNLFSDDGSKRNGACHIYHKNHLSRAMELAPAKDSRCLDGIEPSEELAAIFNSRETFYCYDQFSFYSILAACCGCYSIVHPMPETSREEYIKQRPFGKYLQYGMDGEKVENQAELMRAAVAEQMEQSEKQINDLCHILK